MVSVKSLLQRARTSEDCEAYEPITRGYGFRIGVGARAFSEGAPVLFVEVVLDPFPERPQVDPARLADHGARLAWLMARGYAVECADDSTITCERTVSPDAVPRELRTVERALGSAPPERRARGVASRGPKREA